jgi:pimeloyl-ACP methyl ester carboxylesterase
VDEQGRARRRGLQLCLNPCTQRCVPQTFCGTVAPVLAPQGRLLCPDLRGFGWTDAPSRGYDRETMAQDVLALLDELGLERVDLVGHDWGGWIGFLLALRRPERIRRFVALNVVPPWPSRDPRNLLEAWRMAYQIPPSLSWGDGRWSTASRGSPAARRPSRSPRCSAAATRAQRSRGAPVRGEPGRSRR